jgi:hypothetical protein
MNKAKSSSCKQTAFLRRALAALFAAGIASPAISQICDPLEPVFLAEGPVSNVVDLGSGNGRITAMGVTFQVLPETPIHTPTAALTMTGFADQANFPGRNQSGFLGATVIATGCVKGGVAVADDVFSDVAENVVLGVVTAPLTGAAGDGSGGSLGVNNRNVARLTDARMPAGDIANMFGFPVTPESVTVGTNIAVEGYYGDDGVLHVWDSEVDGGTLVAPAVPQVSIQRFRCANDIEIRGGIYPLPGGTCNFGAPFSLGLFDGAGVAIPFDADEDLTIVNGIAPAQQFCSYRLRPAVTQCPAEVRIVLLNAGVPVAEATAP